MSKSIKKFILTIMLIIFTLGAIYGVLFYFNFFQGFVTIKDKKISSSALPTTNEFKSNYKPKINFDDLTVSNVSDVNLTILDDPILKDTPVISKAQRYYLPIDIISNKLGYTIDSTSTTINLTNGNNNISLSDTNYKTNSSSGNLRGNLLKNDGKYFLSISDIEEIFGLTAIFKFENKSITLLNSNKKDLANSKNMPSDGKVALIRLEDVTAGDGAGSDNAQPKLKALADFLYSEGVKYHIAWIPRFIAPSSNIDNDLLKNNTFENAGFINLLDYLINNGAQIGLHGYTHQYGDSRSAVGTELSSKIQNNEEDTRRVIESSIDTANALNIPYTFFESPHYKATNKQKNIIEEYVQYIYEPQNILLYHKLQKTNRNNLYIPTPLSYVKDLDVSHIENNLSNPRPGELASLFYHPTKEFDFIEVNYDNNTFNVTYSKDSPLQKIVRSIKDNNYVTVHVNQLKNN
ncbi:DUF2334 domain-containing protein [Clostridium paraputrificum]|uniref:DUF2334 domain-containing protein n=1 Tax=Clostridium paraputrificum TaxID=29363 RepID=UPI003D3411FC